MAEPSLHDRIEEERAAASPDAKDLRDFRAYYRGRQRSTLTRDQGRILRGLLGHLLAHNLCQKIINNRASRHELLRWQVEDETVAAFLQDLWVRNSVAALQADAAIAMLRDGNHAIALRWKRNSDQPGDGRVTLHRERWWDGKTGVWISYADDGQPLYAVKDWTEGVGAAAVERRVVWYPDHLERYIRQGDGWRAYPLPGEPENGRVPWERRNGAPLGIPVIGFPNGSDDDTPYGASLLDGGVLGLQDEVNDIQRDITAAARLTGYQMYTATGTEPEVDDSGKPLPLKVGPGQTLQSANPQARYGVLPAGPMDPLKGALMTKIEAICSVTDTPLHIITGEWPSGAALLRAEMPQVSAVSRMNKTAGPRWGSVAHSSTEMQNTFGAGEQLDEDSLITAVWAPPERLDALTQAEVAAARLEIGTDRQGLRELGFTEQEIDNIVEERTSSATTATDTFAAAFNRGGAPLAA